jgi:hypothetical protein
MFKQTCHLPPVITKQKCEKVMYNVQTDMSLTRCDYKQKCEKVMCHVQTDMSLTRCDYKTKEHGILESEVLCSYRHTSCDYKIKEHGI